MYAANTVDCLTLHKLVMKTYNRTFLAHPTDRKWNPVDLLGSTLELHWIPFAVSWVCLEQTIILSASPANATFVPILVGLRVTWQLFIVIQVKNIVQKELKKQGSHFWFGHSKFTNLKKGHKSGQIPVLGKQTHMIP